MRDRIPHGVLHLPTIAVVLLSLAVAAAGASVTAAAGEEIMLSGTAEGAGEVYLFVTGPNLPAGGARLDDIRAGVVTGDPASFTRAEVEDGRWRYPWDTRTAGGVPDAGTYTVYVVRRPAARQDLGDTGYATITVTLTRPGLGAVVGTTGTLAVRSDPPGAEVYVDGVLQGTTPVDLTAVPAGTHTLQLRMPGYATVNESIEIEAGAITEIDRELEEHEPSPIPSPDEPACEECESPPAIGLSPLPAIAAVAVGSYVCACRRRCDPNETFRNR